MRHADIAEALAPFLPGLSPRQLQQVSDYLDLLLKWNARINLTSVRQPEEILTRHFGESFFAARHMLSDSSSSPSPDSPIVFDLGSGAGLPGLPLAIYAPGARATLIEPQNKQA